MQLSSNLKTLLIAVAAFSGSSIAAALNQGAVPVQQHLSHYEATRMSMACVYAIELYGPDNGQLPRVAQEAFDEVDRIDRLMSHYKAESPLSQLNRTAARGPVAVEPELFDFISEAMRYNLDSDGAFDITVGPLMKAWGFFRGEGRMPSAGELAAARRHVGRSHVILNPATKSIRFDEAGVELDLGGIAKGYAVDRVVALLRARGIAAALVSAGGSTIYGLGAPPSRPAASERAVRRRVEGWEVAIQDPIDARKIARTVHLMDRALSVAGSSEKSFEAGGVRYSHIMDPRTGTPAQGMLSVAVLTGTGTAGDALDDAFFVLGPEGSRKMIEHLSGTEAFLFLPAENRAWSMVHISAGR